MEIDDTTEERYLAIMVSKLKHVEETAETAKLDSRAEYQLSLVVVMLEAQINDLKHGDDKKTKEWLNLEEPTR